MTKQVFKILFLFLTGFIFDRCAQVGQLTGGKRDTTPPKLVAAIPALQSVNFNSDLIVLQFDEFVKVNDLANQFIVLPKLKTVPDVQADGKKIKITLKKEELLPNTTYRFHLGQAIVDMNESNAIPNFEYIFSTGSFIDSLTIKGKVLEAFNNKPADNILIALYNNKQAIDSLGDKGSIDSLPYLKLPDYISRSNPGGDFEISNLPYTAFKTYAFDDKNKNNLYDGDVEKIAFVDSVLDLRSDSSISFHLFREEASKVFIKKTLSPYYGLYQIILSKKIISTVRPLDPAQKENLCEINAGALKDTVSLYYKNIQDTLRLAISNQNWKKEDTLIISVPKKGSNAKKFKNMSLNLSGNKLPYHSNPKIVFSNWMDTLKTDRSKIRWKSKTDSLIASTPVKGHWLNATAFELTPSLKEGTAYTLRVDTNAFFNMNAMPNDSLSFDMKTQSKTDFGHLTLKLLLNKKQDYIIQLINEKEEVITEQFISLSLSSSNAVTIDFTDITPGTYLVKIIFDDNKNKKWDTGHLIQKQQPERVIIHSKQMKILSDWEIEEEISVKE